MGETETQGESGHSVGVVGEIGRGRKRESLLFIIVVEIVETGEFSEGCALDAILMALAWTLPFLHPSIHSSIQWIVQRKLGQIPVFQRLEPVCVFNSSPTKRDHRTANSLSLLDKLITELVGWDECFIRSDAFVRSLGHLLIKRIRKGKIERAQLQQSNRSSIITD